MVREGHQVALSGPGWHEPAQGLLLAKTGSGGHVKWASGPDAGTITLTDLQDLVEVSGLHTAAADPWRDSLETAEGFEVEAAISDDEWLWEG